MVYDFKTNLFAQKPNNGLQIAIEIHTREFPQSLFEMRTMLLALDAGTKHTYTHTHQKRQTIRLK